MKVGDLVRDVHPGRRVLERVGLIIENVVHPSHGLGCANRVFKVLWRNGTIGNNVWDYDLRAINEGR
tara:strand:+ start:1667 stop:1867 length:201 start_codon:yes stop_codon:yes gene_type:complete